MKAKFPFLSSSLQSDIFFVWRLLPIWYIMGVDQLIWAVVAFFLTLKILLFKINRSTFVIPNNFFFKIAILFVASYLLSGGFTWFLGLGYFWFLRTLSLYYAGLVFAICIVNFEDIQDVVDLMKVLCFIGAVSVLVNICAISGLLSYDFQGWIGNVIPANFLESEYLKAIIHKSPFDTKGVLYSFGFISIARVKGLFHSCNAYAGFLVISIFLLMYFLFTARSLIKKIMFASVLTLSFLSFLTTLSRSALVGLLVGFAWLLYRLKARMLLKLPFFLLAFCLVIYVFNIQEAFIQRFASHSDQTRWFVYTETFHEILQHPFFGHGTIMQAADNRWSYDLGSHSTILNILFTQGLFGFFMYCLMLGYLFLGLARLKREKLLRDERILVEILYSCFIAVVIQSVWTTWHHGAIFFMAIWCLFGIILKTVSILRYGMLTQK